LLPSPACGRGAGGEGLQAGGFDKPLGAPQHLANANKFGHIRRINMMLGLFVPQLVTPLELLGGSDDDPTPA
jgi:hypothetical protein